MSEWQPARIRFVHASKVTPEQAARALSRTWRVRRADKENIDDRGCDASEWFDVHPRDAEIIAGGLLRMPLSVCEHEILTD